MTRQDIVTREIGHLCTDEIDLQLLATNWIGMKYVIFREN